MTMRWAFPLGLSLSPDAIRAVRIARRGRRLRVAARRSVPLAKGALTVAPSGLAIADEEAFLGALKEALAPGRDEVALAIPDVCCVAHVQRFSDLKARRLICSPFPRRRPASPARSSTGKGRQGRSRSSSPTRRSSPNSRPSSSGSGEPSCSPAAR
jgi:hypothetical protein